MNKRREDARLMVDALEEARDAVDESAVWRRLVSGCGCCESGGAFLLATEA